MSSTSLNTSVDWSGLIEKNEGRIDVVAILATPDNRYLMQKRDNIPGIFFPDHWGGFGGGVEPGETVHQAITRELEEELEFTPRNAKPFTELAMPMDALAVPFMVKVFFEIAITEQDISQMVQREGAGKKLFMIDDLLKETKIVPWDIWGMMLHSRKGQVLKREMAP